MDSGTCPLTRGHSFRATLHADQSSTWPEDTSQEQRGILSVGQLPEVWLSQDKGGTQESVPPTTALNPQPQGLPEPRSPVIAEGSTPRVIY